MSTSPESDLDLELHFLPAWARQSPDVNRYANYEGGEGPRGRGGRPPGRERGGPGPRGDRGRPGDRGVQRGGPRGGDRPPGPRRDFPGGERRRAQGAEHEGRGRREFVRERPEPLPDVLVTLTPEEKGVESLARQIKFSGRAYPMFEIAGLILRKPDRYHVTFAEVKKADGQVAQTLWLCNVDDTLWLSQDEAVNHILRRHFDLFYQTEKTPTDPPKGTYTFVAQCGLSGVILGPPNFHDYQNKLLKLHASRFSRMPFEAYKAKIRIVRDEAVVKKWVEDQSYRTEYVCLNVPDSLRLGSRDEVEKHFREVHVPNLVRQAASWTTSGVAAQQLPSSVLRQIFRQSWEDQNRFPLRLVNVLSQQFASHGLQFFKVNKTVTHVAVARPHYLDLELSPVSEGIRRIVEFINGNAGCNRRQLVEALAPSPVPPVVAPAAPPEVAPPAPAEGASPEAAQAPAAATPAQPPAPPEPTPEQTVVISDLHWLIHQGHVIEFATGKLETAKKPKPRPEPVKPAPAKPAAPRVEEGAPAAVAAAVATTPEALAAPESPSVETAAPFLEAPAPEASARVDVATAGPGVTEAPPSEADTVCLASPPDEAAAPPAVAIAPVPEEEPKSPADHEPSGGA